MKLTGGISLNGSKHLFYEERRLKGSLHSAGYTSLKEVVNTGELRFDPRGTGQEIIIPKEFL